MRLLLAIAAIALPGGKTLTRLVGPLSDLLATLPTDSHARLRYVLDVLHRIGGSRNIVLDMSAVPVRLPWFVADVISSRVGDRAAKELRRKAIAAGPDESLRVRQMALEEALSKPPQSIDWDRALPAIEELFEAGHTVYPSYSLMRRSGPPRLPLAHSQHIISNVARYPYMWAAVAEERVRLTALRRSDAVGRIADRDGWPARVLATDEEKSRPR
jgi:hypothetical protein